MTDVFASDRARLNAKLDEVSMHLNAIWKRGNDLLNEGLIVDLEGSVRRTWSEAIRAGFARLIGRR